MSSTASTAHLSPEEERLKRLYGKLPTRSDLLQRKLKDRKYFDSGDYAMSQAGRVPPNLGVAAVGSQIPTRDDVPRGVSLSPQKRNLSSV